MLYLAYTVRFLEYFHKQLVCFNGFNGAQYADDKITHWSQANLHFRNRLQGLNLCFSCNFLPIKRRADIYYLKLKVLEIVQIQKLYVTIAFSAQTQVLRRNCAAVMRRRA